MTAITPNKRMTFRSRFAPLVPILDVTGSFTESVVLLAAATFFI
jgi:hypothetical protein